MSEESRAGGRRFLDRWRLVSPSGAEVVSLRQLPRRERARLLAPSAFTTANMMSGFTSVLLAFEGRFTAAALLLVLSVALDVADGFVARRVGATSPFGLQLDSLADLVSFGLAPAVLVHLWALDAWPFLSWAVAFLWLACAAFRLARFNVTIDPAADKRYFVGLPSPGAAGVVVATILALDSPLWGPGEGPWRAWFPLLVGVVPALLMVVTVRFRSFRSLLSPRGTRARVGTGAVLLAIALGMLAAPGPTLVVVAYGYVLTAPLGVVTAPLRERLFGPAAVAPPRRRLRSVLLPLDADEAVDGPGPG